MKKYVFFIALTIIFTTFPSYSINKNDCVVYNKGILYKEDYVQACKLISKNYIYLEKKLHKTRGEFLKESIAYSESIQWQNKDQFIEEIQKLRSKFNDGHFSSITSKRLFQLEYLRFRKYF